MQYKDPTTVELFEQALTGGTSWGDWGHSPSSSAVGSEAPTDMQAAFSIDQLQVHVRLGELPEALLLPPVAWLEMERA